VSGVPHLLVVEDEAPMRRLLIATVVREGWRATGVESGDEATALLDSDTWDLCLLDLHLPGQVDGMALLDRLQRRQVPALVITGYASIDSAVAAMRAGAADYLAKPVEPEEVVVRCRRVLAQHQITEENRRLHHALDERLRFEQLIGDSPVMVALRRRLERLLDVDTTCLIVGETGTGKELVARTLHFAGGRAGAPFLPLDCGVYTEELFGDCLFGHLPGAFTGAVQGRAGLFEEAGAGTVFLDEVQNLTPPMQARFLRLLEERTVQRLGGGPVREVRARVVAAANEDLAAAVEAGGFRADLYFRLNVVRVDLPPLRARRADILPLARHFLAAHASRLGRPPLALTGEVVHRLESYGWPGNVRELANLLERATILGDLGEVAAGMAEAAVPEPVASESAPLLALVELEQRAIAAALARCNGNKQEAARLLGIDPTTLRRKVHRYRGGPT